MHFKDTKLARILSSLLAAVLVFMSLPVEAAWQCPDGTPCPSNCPMLHPSMKPVHPSIMPCCAHGMMTGCPLCAKSSHSKIGISELHKSVVFTHSHSCTSTVCIQKHVKHHTFVVTNGIHHYFSASQRDLTKLVVVTQPLDFINPLHSAISRTYRPPPSRAPPAF